MWAASLLCFLISLLQVKAKNNWRQPFFFQERDIFGNVDFGRFTPGGYQAGARHLISSRRRFPAFDGRIHQRLDHFNKSFLATWEQLYYYNFKYTNSNKFKYAFLVVGGEGPLRPANDVREIHIVDENNIVVQWAKKYGAALFALEHRFYGESRPKPDTSVENLKYLNSRQAIEDIAYFIQEMNKEYGSPDSVWVTFGASYAGSLALWARQAYPDLIAGAVGSSAPLEITLDFWGLKDGVGDAFRSQSVRCAENIGKAFTEMSDMMKSELGRMKLQELFAYFTTLCTHVFQEGFFAARVQEEGVDKTNLMYGGSDNYKGSNLVVTSGLNDPWQPLSKLTAKDPSVVTVSIEGGHHCADMYIDAGANVDEAHSVIEENVRRWLNSYY